MGRAFAHAMLRYRSFIWNDQTSLANALPDVRKDAVTDMIELIRGSLNTQLSGNPFQSVYFEHNGQNLHTVVGGNPVGETLVFIHGFPSFWYSFAKQLAHFHQDYRVIAIDGLGVNHSDAPQTHGYYSLQALSDHVLALLDYLEIEQFHLVGHDWGAALALGMAQQTPHRIRTVTGISAPPQNVILELVQTLLAGNSICVSSCRAVSFGELVARAIRL